MKTTLKPFTAHIVALVTLLLAALAVPLTAGAQPIGTCESFPETEQEICGLFLTYWEHNGGLPVFGIPVTGEFSELSTDTLAQQTVQYYERERFELHPENQGTPYHVLLGRLGVDLLEFNGIDWMSLPKANPSDAHYMPATGQAIAPEFWAYWSSHGLDFGDAGVSFRESLALFGYPVTPAQVETNADGDTVLTQWFERARFELHGDTVLLGRLGAEVNDSDGQFAIRVQLEMAAAMQLAFDEHLAPGNIASVRIPGVGQWTHVIGQANPDTGAPYTLATYHRIGSITKTFTATTALRLVDQGLLDLDSTVDAWFDGVTYGDQITVRMLLNMTSGIASYTGNEHFLDTFFADPRRVWQPQELVDIALGLPPSFEPGTDYEYSNSNYVMLGLIIEDVTGKPFRTVLQEQILDPLGLVHTSFPAEDDTQIPEPYARGTAYSGTGELQDATNWNSSWTWTAGQLISTQDDMHLWARASATGELLSPAMQAERLTWVPVNPDRSYGMGQWYGLGIDDFSGWFGHGGSIPGYNSELRYRPDLGASLIVFANSDIPDQETITSPANAAFIGISTILNREYPLPPAS